MNTRINYTYADGGNWKKHNSIVVPGRLTNDQKREIVSCCMDKQYFVPSQVGLPEERFDKWTEDDTPFFQIGDPFFEETTDIVTHWINLRDMVAMFKMAKDRWACNWYN